MSSAPTPDSQGRPPKLSQVMEKKSPNDWVTAIERLKEANSAISVLATHLGGDFNWRKSFLFTCLEVIFPSASAFNQTLNHLGEHRKPKKNSKVNLQVEEVTVERFFDLQGELLCAAKVNVECMRNVVGPLLDRPVTMPHFEARRDLIRLWNLLFLNNESADIPEENVDLPEYEFNNLANTVLKHNFLPSFRDLHAAKQLQWLDQALQKLESATNQFIRTDFMKKFFNHNTESDAVKYFWKVLISKESPASLRAEFWETLLDLAFVSHIVEEEAAAKAAKEKAAEEAKKKAAEEAAKDAEYDMLDDVTPEHLETLKVTHNFKSLARHRTFSRHSNPLLDNFSLRQQGRMLAAYQKAETLGY